ncbi:TetR/AcrR family transcriptional regulator C-terminal domain-containing protein [Clostridium sp. DSM 8431]|uniref:TetR/AcrR family transcriptional regulator C-terminal domain-containing protein n=1 Tax=Clostridium sp. DSM 8431 TaxID=1761781 RepID=UPI001A9A522C|nr:TetR/AcrR family transcriptional regulator C-terminal domain-containing protein [Clostridium sp. DSM 8431]
MVLIIAINIKEIISDSLISLCETMPLESIKIKQILEKSGVSRQTFYNHFIDKNHLIQYIYESKIVPDFNGENDNISFYKSLLISFENMKKYSKFMKEACLIEGQNCLKDYIFKHCKEFDLKWHQELYGSKPMPDTLKFATEYHAMASTSMALSWILSDMIVPCDEIAKMIVKMRGIGMEELFEGGETKGNPYEIID